MTKRRALAPEIERELAEWRAQAALRRDRYLNDRPYRWDAFLDRALRRTSRWMHAHSIAQLEIDAVLGRRREADENYASEYRQAIEWKRLSKVDRVMRQPGLPLP